jgi:hypothetical protein
MVRTGPDFALRTLLLALNAERRAHAGGRASACTRQAPWMK